MWFKLLFVFVTLVSLSLANDVLELSDDDFSTRIDDFETTLVMFYVPWCGHYKRLKPKYDHAAKLLRDSDPAIALAQVDCDDANEVTCDEFSISRSPTLLIFKNGIFDAEYDGPRDSDGIVKYMKAQTLMAITSTTDGSETR